MKYFPKYLKSILQYLLLLSTLFPITACAAEKAVSANCIDCTIKERCDALSSESDAYRYVEGTVEKTLHSELPGDCVGAPNCSNPDLEALAIHFVDYEKNEQFFSYGGRKKVVRELQSKLQNGVSLKACIKLGETYRGKEYFGLTNISLLNIGG